MQALLRDLGAWFWRLVPANPIIVRVVCAGGRRIRHLWLRSIYLSVLALVAVIGVVIKQTGEASLADLAKNATQVFQAVSIVQLAMVCILAPVFTSAAITQEKNSQTYSILLATPLTNAQIVLGSLLSRLYFVFMLLLAGIPLFCIMMVYGGVTGDKIALALGLCASTATFTGALAITISVVRIGTGRTIFSFYLAIALYLIVVYSLSSLKAFIPPEVRPAPGRSHLMSGLAAFHPFLALWVVLGMTPAPPPGAVAHYGFPFAALLAWPAYSYITLTLLASVLLVLLSIAFVRRGAREGEATLWTRLFKRRARPGAEDQRTRRPRQVWHNPVAWREAVTGAAAGGGYALRTTMLIVGLVIGFVLLVVYESGLPLADTRLWLYGIIAVELGITLFVATTTAATSMTREKESNTLELVLATPLTSAAIIRGKITGLVTSAGPMLLVPYLTVLLFVIADAAPRLWRSKGWEPVVQWETLLSLPVLLVAFTVFACMMGLQASIKSRRTLGAVFTSMSIVIGVFAAMGGCALAVKNSSIYLAAAFMPLTPFSAPFVLIDPAAAVGAGPSITRAELASCRWIAFIAAVCSAGVYALVGLAMHRSMVRNFDMIIRKQTA